MQLAIVIPTFNEQDALPILVEELLPVTDYICANGHTIEYIIVDDNSTDKTGQYASALAKSDDRFRYIHREERGLATAVLHGWSNSNADVIGVMDADLSHPPEVLRDMITAMAEADMVIGSRNIAGGTAEEWPWYRKIFSIAATGLTRLLGVRVSDPMSGFFLLKRSVITDTRLSPIGYKLLLEILVKGRHRTIKEIPYIFRNRSVGSSKMNGTIITQYLKHLWLLHKWRRHRSNE